MNKILVPKNPDETIILPPYVDFRSKPLNGYVAEIHGVPYGDKLTDRELDQIATDAIKQSKQEGRE